MGIIKYQAAQQDRPSILRREVHVNRKWLFISCADGDGVANQVGDAGR